MRVTVSNYESTRKSSLEVTPITLPTLVFGFGNFYLIVNYLLFPIWVCLLATVSDPSGC